MTAGVRSSRHDWDIDASLSYGRNNFDFGLKNSINASLGPTSPTEFALGSYSFDQTVANLDLRRELTRGVGGPDHHCLRRRGAQRSFRHRCRRSRLLCRGRLR